MLGGLQVKFNLFSCFQIISTKISHYFSRSLRNYVMVQNGLTIVIWKLIINKGESPHFTSSLSHFKRPLLSSEFFRQFQGEERLIHLNSRNIKNEIFWLSLNRKQMKQIRQLPFRCVLKMFSSLETCCHTTPKFFELLKPNFDRSFFLNFQILSEKPFWWINWLTSSVLQWYSFQILQHLWKRTKQNMKWFDQNFEKTNIWDHHHRR